MENLEIIGLFGGIYKNKRVLITGNSGFKGSWLSLWLQKLEAEVIGYSLNDITSPSHFSLLKLKHRTYFNNILDKKNLEKVFLKHQPEIVFHLAAQSLVRESYRNPTETYEVNVMGTLNVLEAARKCGSVKAIVNITTDKVYENLEENTISYKETDRIGGFDLYSSSKACSEILSSSYRRSFFSDNKTLLATARAGNVIGGGDWAEERLIPDLIRSISKKKSAKIRNPHSIRPWQHVLEPLSGYLFIGQKMLEGDTAISDCWNFGPANNESLSVIDVLKQSSKLWPAILFETATEQNILHEAQSLRLDCTKANTQLNWKPVWNTDQAIIKTIDWYKQFYEMGNINTELDLQNYVKEAIQLKSIWTT